MEPEYLSIPALQTQPLSVEELKVDRAKGVALALSSAGHSRLQECQVVTETLLPYFAEGDEIVIYDSDIDVGQRPVNDIRYTERLGILFPSGDRMVPLVFSLRASFPLVMHRICMPFEKPVCLCVYDQPWELLKLSWRPIKFIEDIRHWLAKTADNTLHADDQPLEPLLLQFHGQIILPSDIRHGESLFLLPVSEQKNLTNFLALRKKMDGCDEFQVLIIDGKPQEHGIIDHSPNSLADLQRFLAKAGIDLVSELRTFLGPGATDPAQLKKRLMVVVALPKTNAAKTENGLDYYSFIVGNQIEEIVVALKLAQRGPTGWGQLLFAGPVAIEALEAIQVAVLVTHVTLNTAMAQFLSSASPRLEGPTIVQIGAGALGSQLFVSLAKTGYGTWTLIDDDILLPHNTVRHHLDQHFLGSSKSIILANLATNSFQGGTLAVGIFDNYLSPLNKPQIDEVMKKTELIVDCSASIPVARDLAQRRDITAKRISVFLNPKGTDLVLLGEDPARKYPLDILEYQYYRALLSHPSLDQHLENSDRIRYAISCRDITSRIPQELVALHAAISAASLKIYVDADSSQITIWHSREDMSVERIDVQATEFEYMEVGEWKVYIDEFLINKISEARLAKLPNETGGILIGGYDFHRKIIYLVDTVLSPPDSEESPGSYVRGTSGLKEELEQIQSRTSGHLRYAGEWHSHPIDYPPVMSQDDAVLFVELKSKMEAAGLPATMVIAADDRQIAIYIS